MIFWRSCSWATVRVCDGWWTAVCRRHNPPPPPVRMGGAALRERRSCAIHEQRPTLLQITIYFVILKTEKQNLKWFQQPIPSQPRYHTTTSASSILVGQGCEGHSQRQWRTSVVLQSSQNYFFFFFFDTTSKGGSLLCPFGMGMQEVTYCTSALVLI